MKSQYSFYVFVVILLLSSIITLSCATKSPVLYKDGAPLSISEYEKIAQSEFDNKRYNNAIEVYEAIITNFPDYSKAVAWAHYEVGFCYYVQEKYDEAEKYFRIVINEFQEPAANKLAQDMLAKIVEAKK